MADAICGLSQKRSDGSAGGGLPVTPGGTGRGRKTGKTCKKDTRWNSCVSSCLSIRTSTSRLPERKLPNAQRDRSFLFFFTFKMDDDMQCAALNLPNRWLVRRTERSLSIGSSPFNCLQATLKRREKYWHLSFVHKSTLPRNGPEVGIVSQTIETAKAIAIAGTGENWN